MTQETLGAGVAFSGRLWCGDGRELDRGRVLVNSEGVVTAVGTIDDVDVPYGALEVDATWIGPGLVDHHVHLAFGAPDVIVSRGVVAVRDLGAPPADAMRWRALTAPRVHVAGPLLTAPGGYPSQSWGRNGFAAFVDEAEQSKRLVQGLATQVDVIKLALEPRAGPVPAPDICAAIVESAHESGREVTCHALTVATVQQALDAGVDELAHTPVERLPTPVVDRIAAAGVRVISTLQTHRRSGDAVINVQALVSAGVPLRYGTDLGNAGTTPGADPRELELLAGTALGPDGALQAATEPVAVGTPAGLVALRRDPREHSRAWTQPHAVMVGSVLLLRSA
jgi:imidazolonepropionase-like amidohydrolase